MKTTIPILVLLASPALADGPLIGNQCDEAFVSVEYPGVPAEIVKAWNDVGLAAWQDACTTPGERLRARGWTDEDLMAWAFDGGGHDVPVPPAPVPLTGSIYMMIIALAVLLGWRKA